MSTMTQMMLLTTFLPVIAALLLLFVPKNQYWKTHPFVNPGLLSKKTDTFECSTEVASILTLTPLA